MKQEVALDILKSGKNVFLTGSAGSGKTYVLNQYIQYLRDRGVPTAVTASTGIAAVHLSGQTIHSWSGVGIRDEITDRDLEKIAKKKPVRDRVTKAQVLIIDEISMLSGQTLNNIDKILRFLKVSFDAFGGIQVVVCGDFFQLPPVSKIPQPSHKKFAFMSDAWVKSSFNVCYLTQQFRQSEGLLSDILHQIRTQDYQDDMELIIQEKIESSQETDSSVTKLFTHNIDVDRVNQTQLDALETPQRIFASVSRGSKAIVDSFKKSILAPEILYLKEKARVMFVKNNYEAGYMNGTLGTVIGFDDKEGWPMVETEDGVTITVGPSDWSMMDEYGQVVASYAQMPLRLAWAITVHKSQGMTLDSAEMDLSRTFEAGQGYVALSRVRSWEGLFLKGCNDRTFQLDGLAIKADERFQELSHQCEAVLGSGDVLQKLFDDFVLRSGGTTDQKAIASNQAEQGVFKIPEKKVSTYEQTRVLLEEGRDLSAIAEIREMTVDTIIRHVGKLKQDLPKAILDKLRPSEKILKAIKQAEEILLEQKNEDDFGPKGDLKIVALHRSLKGKYSYQDIRKAQLFW